MPVISSNLPIASIAQPLVVIGGGVIGAACASSLAEAGCSVLLIERGSFGGGCSHANCGYVSPSHILPLCRPGMIRYALKSLFRRDSPFQLRPRLDLAQWTWCYRFARRCTHSSMLAAGHARQNLLDSSRTLYDQLTSHPDLEGCEWETRGLYFVYKHQAEFEEFRETDTLLKREFGLAAEACAEDELLKREPALKPGLAGGWYYSCDAHLRPDKLMDGWRRRLTRLGVEIRENCEFMEFHSGDRGVSAIQTNCGRIEVDQVVVATGAWTRLLGSQLATSIPIEPGKGYSITMPRPARCPTTPMIFADDHVAITPFESGYRIGSTMEFAGFDESIRPERLKILTDGATRYLHEPLAEPVVETWYGWRPMSADGVPMIGRLPKFDNVWLAAGHSMLGVSMAPATGKLIAELVTGVVPHIDPHPYRVDRF